LSELGKDVIGDAHVLEDLRQPCPATCRTGTPYPSLRAGRDRKGPPTECDRKQLGVFRTPWSDTFDNEVALLCDGTTDGDEKDCEKCGHVPEPEPTAVENRG